MAANPLTANGNSEPPGGSHIKNFEDGSDEVQFG
jgi:hypothetical protein